jgi:hypothetical protein
MGPLLYRIWRRLSAQSPPSTRAGEAASGGLWRQSRGRCGPARRPGSGLGLGAFALLAGLATGRPASALPIEPAGTPAAAPTGRTGAAGAGLPQALPGGLDPAPWASSVTGPRASQDAPRRPPFTGDPGAERLPHLVDGSLGEALGPLLPGGADLSQLGSAPAPRARPGLRETLLATPLGEEILRLAVEVFAPAVDSSGRLHVSFLGHGDYTLPQRGPVPAMQSLDAAGRDLTVLDSTERWRSEAGSLTPAPGRFAAGEEPLTVGQFVALLTRELVAFATHPLTLLAAVLGAGGYVAFRLAIERARRRTTHAGGHRRHPRAPRHHRSRRTRTPSSRHHQPRAP